jgi:hypothetical protein
LDFNDTIKKSAADSSEAAIGLRVKIPKTPQALVVGISNHDVVENFDFEKLTGSNEITGDF